MLDAINEALRKLAATLIAAVFGVWASYMANCFCQAVKLPSPFQII